MAGPSKGSKPDKILRDALILELNRMTDAEDGQKVKKVNRVVHKLVEAAVEGKLDAIKEVWDRVEGKATQTLAGDPDAPLFSFDGLRELLGAKLDRIADESAATGDQVTTH